MFPSIEEIIRQESGRVVATLLRMTGNLQLAEDAFGEATLEALSRWPTQGLPERPGAWLTTVARRKALDALRQEASRTRREQSIAALEEPDFSATHTVRDDLLRLIFTCCHPALAIESRVALALRVLAGLTTAEIASAFLVSEATIGKRITRAKHKIAANRIPYRIPPDNELPDRLAAVLAVVQAMYTIGHHPPAGSPVSRVSLTVEAVRLAKLLAELMPDEPECLGLVGLLQSAQARHGSRFDEAGMPILLADADRGRWDRQAAEEAVAIVEQALRRGRPGPYQVRAAISCLHAVAPSVEATDWPQIATLYLMLESMEPSLAVRVNRAVAVAESDGPEAALALLDVVDGETTWHLLHAVRADLLRRLGRHDEEAAALTRALAAEMNNADRALLQRRLIVAESARGR